MPVGSDCLAYRVRVRRPFYNQNQGGINQLCVAKTPRYLTRDTQEQTGPDVRLPASSAVAERVPRERRERERQRESQRDRETERERETESGCETQEKRNTGACSRRDHRQAGEGKVVHLLLCLLPSARDSQFCCNQSFLM